MSLSRRNSENCRVLVRLEVRIALCKIKKFFQQNITFYIFRYAEVKFEAVQRVVYTHQKPYYCQTHFTKNECWIIHFLEISFLKILLMVLQQRGARIFQVKQHMSTLWPGSERDVNTRSQVVFSIKIPLLYQIPINAPYRSSMYILTLLRKFCCPKIWK